MIIIIKTEVRKPSPAQHSTAQDGKQAKAKITYRKHSMARGYFTLPSPINKYGCLTEKSQPS
jgi:hypothetical protein